MKSSEKSPQGSEGGKSERPKSESSSTERSEKDKSKGSADRGDKEKSKETTDRGDKDKPSRADREDKDGNKGDGGKRKESKTEERGGTKGGERNGGSITVKVGATLPEGRSLNPVSKTIIEKYPEYRNYREVLIDDRIVIVDPSTRKIVRTVTQSEGMRAKDCR